VYNVFIVTVTNKESEMGELTYKTWEEYTPLEQAQMTYWDMYKDAYNFRPRGVDTSKWTLVDFEREFKVLQFVIDRATAQRLEEEAQAVVKFEARVQSIIDLGAKDRAMALRWIHEAEGTDGDDEYLCYTVGIPYGYFK
jgi:hypothetical protein